ncbi:CD276 antigen homolog [Anabas testudineus]|uniref:CD276 antigen homolog n=1 Tax=Anabas testudineus TaxID=64144 RepID=UPI00143CD0CF|nr:CD276 antigen homolog [Anabas testudineus]
MFRCLSASLCSMLVLLLVTTSSSVSAVHHLQARLGQTVLLPCRAPSSGSIRAAEWSRPDQELEYVFFYRDGQPDETQQHPSFQNRVELADRQMKEGNLSVILKDVISSDAGTYECRVKVGTAAHVKRAVIKSEAISTVHLTVEPSVQHISTLS